MKKRFLFFLYSVSFCCHAFAQTDTTYLLPPAEIIASRTKLFNSSLPVTETDSVKLMLISDQHLTALLENEASFYIRNYSNNGLSTPSLRGGSAYHTSILWNGFQINNPMNGFADLNLLNNFLFDNISIQYGGTASLLGSGAVSGNISLANKADFTPGYSFTAGLRAGSYDLYSENLGIECRTAFYNGSVKIVNETNLNNYLFYNDSENRYEHLKHGKGALTGILSENHFRTGKQSMLSLNGWYQKSNRNLPPAMNLYNTNAIQDDASCRLNAAWQKSGNRISYSIRAAYFNEEIFYEDELNGASLNQSKTFIAENEYRFHISEKHLVDLGINFTGIHAEADEYTSDKNLNRYAAFIGYSYQSANKKLKSEVSFRQEISQLQNSPFIYSAGINYRLYKNVTFSATASKVYRNPTLNDLYWNPGGNKNLRAEDGFSEEGGIKYKSEKIKRLSVSADITFYNRKVNDWIIWLPVSSVWAPANLLQVNSRGIESSVELKLKTEKSFIRVRINGAYTLSTNKKSALPLDASVGKQLIYIPKTKTTALVSAGNKNITTEFLFAYTGKRFTSTDNSELLPPYHTAQFQLNYYFPIKKCGVTAFIRILNIYNTSYESFLNRPMPLRTYEGGISIKFNSSNTK
jgi:vitamin B12 transporter